MIRLFCQSVQRISIDHGTAMLVALAANALAFSMRKWMVPCVSFIMVF